MDTMNLVQHRSGPDVWERTENAPAERDPERWMVAIAAGGCLAAGYFAPRPKSFFLALAGGFLGWWAIASSDERSVWRARARAALPGGRRGRNDLITEASEDSFPASDAPSFTSSTGNTLGTSRVMR